MEGSIESIATNNLLLIFSVIIITGIALGRISEILKVPDVILLILTFGSAFILYEGGKEINLKVLNKVKVSVGMLSTVGVVISAVVVGVVAAKIFNLPIMTALLLGAVIASTDPAALIPVFKQVTIKDKIKQTVVSESAFNDAVGAILSSALLGIVMSGQFSAIDSIKELLISAVVGIGVGILVGYLLIILVSDKRVGVFHSYAPIMSMLTVTLAYELATMFHGSGYMAVFMAGLISGNKKIFGIWLEEADYQPTVHFTESIAIICKSGDELYGRKHRINCYQ